MASPFLINEAAPSSFVFAAAPGATRKHILTGLTLTTDTAGLITVGDFVIDVGVGVAEARFGKQIPLDLNTGILVTHSAGGSVRGAIYFETR